MRFSPTGTRGELDSFLIEITAQIFTKMDEDGKPMIDKILDTAGQKGTGKWTAHQRAGSGHAGHSDWRSGICALPLGAERRARGGLDRY